MRGQPDNVHIDATTCEHPRIDGRIAGGGTDAAQCNAPCAAEQALPDAADARHRMHAARARAARVSVIGDRTKGWVNVRTMRRADKRWACECRFISPTGDSTAWVSATTEEGYLSRDLALSAGILLGRELAAHDRR